MSTKSFVQALVEAVPVFDEMILSEIRMEDGWIPWRPEWFAVRESVRKLSEGAAFKPSKPPRQKPMGMPVEITQDRFRAVWPNVTQAWKR